MSQFITHLMSLNILIRSLCLIPKSCYGILLIHCIGTHFINQCRIYKYITFEIQSQIWHGLNSKYKLTEVKRILQQYETGENGNICYCFQILLLSYIKILCFHFLFEVYTCINEKQSCLLFKLAN